MNELIDSGKPLVSSLGLSYDGRRVVCVVPKISPFSDDGRIVLLRGVNGAGKTTWLRWLYSNFNVVMLPCELDFPKHLRPREIEKLFGSSEEHSLFDLLVPEDRPWMHLSAGNRQKTRIRTVLKAVMKSVAKGSAKLLLLDEPTTALDEKAQAALWRILIELAKRHAPDLKIVVATHDKYLEDTFEGSFATWFVHNETHPVGLT